MAVVLLFKAQCKRVVCGRSHIFTRHYGIQTILTLNVIYHRVAIYEIVSNRSPSVMVEVIFRTVDLHITYSD